MSKFGNFLQYVAGDRFDVVKTFSRSLLGQSKDHLLRTVENDRRLVFLSKRFACDLVAGANERTNDGLVLDDLNVFGKVGKMRQAKSQIRNRRDAADGLDRAIFFHFL